MLYNCRCGTTINIATSHFCYIHDGELERLCLYEGSIMTSSPWEDSILDEGTIEHKTYKTVPLNKLEQKCSLDDIEDYFDDEEIDDTIDTDMSLSGWEDD